MFQKHFHTEKQWHVLFLYKNAFFCCFHNAGQSFQCIAVNNTVKKHCRQSQTHSCTMALLTSLDQGDKILTQNIQENVCVDFLFGSRQKLWPSYVHNYNIQNWNVSLEVNGEPVKYSSDREAAIFITGSQKRMWKWVINKCDLNICKFCF